MAADPLDQAAAAILAAHEAGQDVGEFVALALVQAAARLGSTDALLSNRPGSWEAAGARGLMTGTVGLDDEHLADYMRGSPTDPGRT
jgi:hypothetical protein